MPRVRKAFSSKEAESYAGKGGMVQFMKRKRGRPKKRRTSPPVPVLSPVIVRQGRPPTVQRRSPPPTVQREPAPDVPDEPSKSSHVPRTNWGAEPHRTRMEKALLDWKYRTGDALDEEGNPETDYKVFSRNVGIPESTFYKHIHPDPTKRRYLEHGIGRKSILSHGEISFCGDVLARCDRGNEPMTRRDAVDMVQTLTQLSRKVASRQLSRHVIPKSHAAGKIKKTLQKAQATTADRSSINLAQQFRWHSLVDSIYTKLRKTNIGLCQKSGKSFGELMPHFICGLDEMCLQSDANGDMKVFGSMTKKKHEAMVADR